jgi:hypothetical protein
MLVESDLFSPGQIIDRYETLRKQVISEDRISHELTLFMGKGMIEWMIAWKDYTSIKPTLKIQRSQIKINIPSDFKKYIIQQLAEMTMNNIINIERSRSYL